MSEYKLTAIGRLLQRDHPAGPLALPLTLDEYEDPTFIPRLSFRHRPRVPTDVADLMAFLVQHRDHALFIDTNLTWLPNEWWDALLSRPGRVHVTGRVLRELTPFLQRNPGHPMGPALANKHPAIILHPDPDDDAEFKIFQYYASLLSYRRQFLSSAVRRFRTEHGREPTGEEITALKMELQNWAGERTLRLNTKPMSTDHTDEALAFLAIHHAVNSGQRTKILSGDSDVEEQFYAMVRVLTAHYFGLILGRRYAADFTAFTPRALPPELVSKYSAAFEPHNAVIIDLGDRGIHDFIPKLTTFVPISSVTIGKEYMSEVTYGAETTMAEVFRTKAATLGLSSDRLGGRNIHPWMVPVEFQRPDSHGALVAFDKYKTLPTGMRVAHLDIMMTAWPGDPHARVKAPAERTPWFPAGAIVPPPGRRGVVPMFARRPGSASGDVRDNPARSRQP